MNIEFLYMVFGILPLYGKHCVCFDCRHAKSYLIRSRDCECYCGAVMNTYRMKLPCRF